MALQYRRSQRQRQRQRQGQKQRRVALRSAAFHEFDVGPAGGRVQRQPQGRRRTVLRRCAPPDAAGAAFRRAHGFARTARRRNCRCAVPVRQPTMRRCCGWCRSRSAATAPPGNWLDRVGWPLSMQRALAWASCEASRSEGCKASGAIMACWSVTVDPLKNTVCMNSISRLPAWQCLSFIICTSLIFGIQQEKKSAGAAPAIKPACRRKKWNNRHLLTHAYRLPNEIFLFRCPCACSSALSVCRAGPGRAAPGQ